MPKGTRITVPVWNTALKREADRFQFNVESCDQQNYYMIREGTGELLPLR